MHNDEAVNALKFADLLENGSYKYDKNDYHGPTLNYFTLIPAIIRSQKSLREIDEITLRLVSVSFGLGIILLLLLIAMVIGWPNVLIISLLITISPPLVFYSRYYIQEILLVFFNFGLIVSVLRYFLSRKTGWAIAAGIFAGLMFATKGTWILYISIQMIALLTVLIIHAGLAATISMLDKVLKNRHIYLMIFITVIVYMLFFSSFFSNPQGITDSVLAFKPNLSRVGGQSLHNNPWWYYLQVLAGKACYWNFFRADVWLLAGGAAGLIRLMLTKQKQGIAYLFYLFIGISTLLSGVTFSLLPYKTPWNILGFSFGLIFLTTFAISSVISSKSKITGYIVVALVVIHLSIQVYYDNYRNYSNQCNSFVYAHTSNDVYKISDEIHKIEKAISGEKLFFIDVIIQNHEYWPMPWYLRDISHIGWWNRVDFSKLSAPLILTTSPNHDLEKKLYELPPPGQRFLYIPVFDKDQELRPGMGVNLYLRKDYFDIYSAGISIQNNGGKQED